MKPIKRKIIQLKRIQNSHCSYIAPNNYHHGQIQEASRRRVQALEVSCSRGLVWTGSEVVLWQQQISFAQRSAKDANSFTLLSSNKFPLNICFCKLLQKGPKEGWQASCSNPLPWFPWVEIHGSFTKDTLSYPFEQAMILKWNHQLTLSLRYLSFIQEVTRKKLPRSTNKSFRSRKRLARPPGSEAGGDSCFPRAHQALLPA